MPDTEMGLGLQAPASESIEGLLEHIDSGEAQEFKAAFAYATVSGIEKIISGLSESLNSVDPRWLVSFDYGHTEPEAVRRLDKVGSVRVVGAESLRRRGNLTPSYSFHPKFVWIEESDAHHLMMGSSNLTQSALSTNWEGVVFLRAIDPDHSSVVRISSWWDERWDEAHPVTDDLMGWYDEMHTDAVSSRRTTPEVPIDSGAATSEKSDDQEETTSGESEDGEEVDDLRGASIVWGRLGYTQSGSRNQMDIPTEFGRFFIGEDDNWELESEYYVTFRYEGEEIEKKVKFHDGSYQTRIYLPTETNGTRLKELYSEDKFDENSLRYYIAVFRRVGKYEFSLRILPPGSILEVETIIEQSKELDQVVETDKETNRLVGWV